MQIGRRAFLKSSLVGLAYLGATSLPFAPKYAEAEINFSSIKASTLGCVLDCDLQTGLTASGGAPTDNTARINAYLAQASVTNPIKLLLDGGTATSGIIGPSGGYWAIEGIGEGSGFFVLSGSNSMAIRNHSSMTPFDPMTTPPTQAGPVFLKNFYVNGNRGNGTTGNSTSGNPVGIPGTVFYTGIDIFSSQGGAIEGITLFNVAAYSIRVSNVSNYWISKITTLTPSMAVNTDAIHLSGPASFIGIDSCNIQSGDDGVAGNCPEGFGGNISNITISNCRYNSAASCFHGYTFISPNQFSLSYVNVVNCNGTLFENNGIQPAAFLLGNNGSSSDAISNFRASNCTFNSNAYILNIKDSCGDIVLENVGLEAPSSATPYIAGNTTATVSSLTVKGKIYRNTTGSAAAFGLAAISGNLTIAKLVLEFDVENQSGQSFAAIPNLLEMTNVSIGELVIKRIDPTFVTALADSFTNITGIRGPGVLDSGFQIPDANMQNDCDYISATSPNVGKPCIKIGGTVFPFTI